MTVPLIPPGPGIPPSVLPVLKALYDAVSELQDPQSPRKLASVSLKASLPPAADWPECAINCDEINSIVVSTLSAGVYGWTRADGSAL